MSQVAATEKWQKQRINDEVMMQAQKTAHASAYFAVLVYHRAWALILFCQCESRGQYTVRGQ